jgi:hypothetical protein
MFPFVNMCTVRTFFPSARTNFEKLRSQIPVVPLTPGQRLAVHDSRFARSYEEHYSGHGHSTAICFVCWGSLPSPSRQ